MTPEIFEDHCWKGLLSPGELKAYRPNVREVRISAKPALLAIDLYRGVYLGGDKPVSDLVDLYPGSCGEFAWRAIEPTRRLFAAARQAQLPIIHTTGAPYNRQKLRSMLAHDGDAKFDRYAFFEDFQPRDNERVIYKERASAFFGTPLQAYLQQLGCDGLIICGESTSGCVRASAVDAFSAGFHVVLAEECCFDRVELTHKINLFDLHHKYADVMHIDEVLAHLPPRI